MKRYLLVALVTAVITTFVAGSAMAMQSRYKKPGTTPAAEESTPKAKEESPAKEDKPAPQFPENGWHKGPYLAAHGGFMQATNDTNLLTNLKFDGKLNPAVGITFGWDIADWIGPMLQMTYGFATDTVGDGNVDTPVENGREHALNLSLFVRATLPYFTRATWQPSGVKIIPYLKLGGTAHGLYVNANGNGNKTGAFGGGIGFGAGTEFYIWKGVFLAIDFTENVIFQKAVFKTVRGTPNTKIIDGGTNLQAVLLGLVGWHF
ncbi:MAG: outer membrane beta-barrel protein [bacterium]